MKPTQTKTTNLSDPGASTAGPYSIPEQSFL